MPYINQTRRRAINTGSAKLGGYPMAAGELNYAITRLIVQFVEGEIANTISGKLNYQIINDVRGAVDGAKLEFERRVAFPYEDKAIARNGDVYPKEMI